MVDIIQYVETKRIVAIFSVRKLLSIRLFDDDTGKRWSKSVADKNYEILCISQFTLYYSLKGNKPDFRYSMKAEESKEFYNQFLVKLKNSYQSDLVKDGVFGAMMEVDIVNDGPVTIEIESPKKKPVETVEDGS